MSTMLAEELTRTYAQNYQAVLEHIAEAAKRTGRDPQEVRLIAVSKTHPIEQVRAAVAAGITVLGENKPQELAEKAQAIHDAQVHWCAIGHLQRNKAREIAQYAHEFHALDSLKVAEALQRRLDGFDRTLDVFIQVNTSLEEQKGGIAAGELGQFLEALAPFDRLNVRGLMTMAAASTDPAVVRPAFQTLRELRDSTLPGAELSMGMSGDYQWAVEEGATSVRVGSAIFGARNYPNSPSAHEPK